MLHQGISYFSPSKINLFLKIEGKRTDGFHNLSSCFRALDFGDTLFFKEAQEDKFICEKEEIPLDNNNLINQALNLFRKYTKISTLFHITLHKKIFVSAGLGGGSSNAATTLFALNQLTKANLSDEELSMLGARLGSDVSFFLSKGLALCEDKGDVITELDTYPFSHLTNFLLIPFQGSCPTHLIYKQFTFSRCKHRGVFSKNQLLTHLSSKRPIFFNDLESSAFMLFPKLRKIKEDLENFFTKTNTFMAGSGGTLVVWLENESNNNLKEFLLKYPQSVFTKSICRSNKNKWFSCNN